MKICLNFTINNEGKQVAPPGQFSYLFRLLQTGYAPGIIGFILPFLLKIVSYNHTMEPDTINSQNSDETVQGILEVKSGNICLLKIHSFREPLNLSCKNSESLIY